MREYIFYLVSPNMTEKFFKNHIVDNETRVIHYNLKKTNISFTTSLDSFLNSPFSILSHIMFLELIVGQKFTFNFSTKQINEFNLKPGHIIGASVDIRHNTMYDFITRWISVYQNMIRGYKGYVENFESGVSTFSIGLSNIDIFETVITTFERWAFIPDSHRYGCKINLVFNWADSALKDCFFSHLGFKRYEI